MLGYQNALAGTMAGSAVAKQSMQPEKPKRSFGETVGRIGDILAIMGGREPIYQYYQQQRAAEQQANAAQEGLMGFAAGPQTPQDVARLIGLGIDPAKINALRNQPDKASGPASIQEIEYLNDPNISIEKRQQLQTLINNRSLSGALIGGPDTGYRTNPLYQPLGGSAPAPAQQQPPAVSQPAAPQGDALSVGDLQRVATSFPTAEAMMGWMRRNNIVVRVSNPQEAANLPSGTRLILPDGSPGVVP